MQPKYSYDPRPNDRFLGTLECNWGGLFDLYWIKDTKEFLK